MGKRYFDVSVMRIVERISTIISEVTETLPLQYCEIVVRSYDRRQPAETYNLTVVTVGLKTPTPPLERTMYHAVTSWQC